MSKITFDDKTNSQISSLPASQKVRAQDINELKDGINVLHDVPGWEYVIDDNSGGNVTITSSDSLVEINALGANTERNYQPLEIRGQESITLWDESTNRITPINVGDTYDIRVGFNIVSKSGNPSALIAQIDIGGGVSPTIVIGTFALSLTNLPTPATQVVIPAIPAFTLDTFLANGGQIFWRTNSGSLVVNSVNLLVIRTSSNIA